MGPSSGKQKNKAGYNSPLPPSPPQFTIIEVKLVFYDSLKLKKSKKILKKLWSALLLILGCFETLFVVRTCSSPKYRAPPPLYKPS